MPATAKWALLFLGFAIFSNVSLGKIRFYAVVDTFDGKVGPGCEKSFTMLSALLLNAAKLRGKTARDFEILQWKREGTAIVPTREAVLLHFASLNKQEDFKPTDILWFYYCGHGEMDPVKKHILKMADDLPRDELVKAMEAVGAQAVILTTDACAVAGRYIDEGLVGSGGPPVFDHDLWEVFEHIAQNTVGTVNINSAMPGTRAFVDPDPKEGGAVFSNALHNILHRPIASLDLNKDRIVSWPEIFLQLRDRTQIGFTIIDRKYRVALDNNLGDDKSQTPVAFSLGNQAEGEASAILFQRPFERRDDFDGEGVMFLLRTQLAPKFVGHKLTLSLTFFDTAGQPIVYQPGHKYLPYDTIDVTETNRRPNDNKPWGFFVPNPAVLAPEGQEGSLRVAVTLWDRSDGDKRVFEQLLPMVSRDPGGLGPRN